MYQEQIGVSNVPFLDFVKSFDIDVIDRNRNVQLKSLLCARLHL